MLQRLYRQWKAGNQHRRSSLSTLFKLRRANNVEPSLNIRVFSRFSDCGEGTRPVKRWAGGSAAKRRFSL